MLAGLALYFVKVLHSPAYFTLHDELLHWKTADAILQSGHLFAENPLLPVSPLFPGLHLATVSLAQLLEIDIYSAGVILLALMRVAVHDRHLRPARIRQLDPHGWPDLRRCSTWATAISFSSLRSTPMNSVALPVAVLLLCVVVRRAEFAGMRRMLLNMTAILLVIVVVATHHVTSYMVIDFLLASLLIAAGSTACSNGL